MEMSNQVVEKFQHCRLRYDALLVQLRAAVRQQAAAEGAEGGAAGHAGPAPDVLLKRLLAAFGGEHANQHSAGSAVQPAERIAADPMAALPPPSAFERAFLQEVQRLRLLVQGSLEQLWMSLLDTTGQLRGLGEELLQAGTTRGEQSQALSARLAELQAAYDATAQELVAVEQFVRQNAAAAAELAQTHDVWQQARCTSALGHEEGGEQLSMVEAGDVCYLEALRACLLGGLTMEPLLLGLSDGYELCRLMQRDAAALAGQHAKWEAPDKFERVTRKFWLRPEHVVRFKAAVMRHLPILIYGDRTRLTESDTWEMRYLRDQRGVSDSAQVSSVYYDNLDALPSYHSRLRKDDMASVVRLRWYGERSGSGDQAIYVERKVHRDRASGELSYKERAPMAQRHVQAFTGGALVPEVAEGRHAELLADVQQFLLQGEQAPLVRTVYHRTAFQESSNNQVRISLDSELQMVREEAAPRAPGDWCRDLGAPLPEADVVRFPYAVVEIKLQCEPPSWVEDLLQTGMLMPVPKFSKFLHGTALLFQQRCAEMPYWFLPDERDPSHMTPAAWDEMADPADEYLQTRGTSWLFPVRDAEGGSGSQQAANAAPETETAPYRPNPLRFLRRIKTAPGSSSRNEAGTTAAAAGAAGVTAAGGLASITVAGSVGQADVAAAAGAVMPPPQQPLAGSVAALAGYSATGGEAAATPPAVPAGREGQLPSLRYPQTSFPLDSERDLEAGMASGDDKSSGTPPSKGGQPASSSGKAASAFAALRQKLSGSLASSSGCEDKEHPAGRARAVVRTRVEPKTFFANERTFLQWLQISVLILMTATSMLSGTGVLSGLTGSGGNAGASCDPSDKACFASKLSGAIIAPVGLLFLIYALYQYRLRTYQIMRRETTRYDDQRGTTLLTVILAAVFLLTFVLSMIYSF